MRILAVLLLTVVMAVATLFLGWWSVPVVAFLWGLLAARLLRRPAGAAALAAALAWAALLAMDAMGGRLGGLGTLFGSIAKLPPGLFFALSLIFPALLAWSAAALGADLRGGPRARRYYVPSTEVLGPATRVKGKARAHG